MTSMKRLKLEYLAQLDTLKEEGVIFKPIVYTYKDKTRSFSLTVIPHKQIATVAKRTPNEDGEFDIEILRESDLDYEGICYHFPPLPALKRKGYEYNMLSLFRSILYELYQSMDSNDYGFKKEKGNVRGVWYSHFIHIVEDVLGLSETASVQNAINNAWEDMIVSGLFTYDDVKVISAKENVRESNVRDSPFNNIIVAVEKEDLFEDLKWIPKLFNCTLIAAGGQPSRAVARVFIRQLKDEGVDLDQHFHMCAISDCDPAGYYIQDSFRHQFDKSIEYYGGSGKVEIHRLFVRKDQVTANLLDHDAVPCRDKAVKPAARKAENTKWEAFCEVTNGGLYKRPPGRWDGPTYLIDGEQKVRAKLELNAFGKLAIEMKILQEIFKLIDDPSKIMIPEIMRILNLLKQEVALAEYEKVDSEQIEPIINRYIQQIKTFYREYSREINQALESADDTYYDDIDDIFIQFTTDVEDIQDDIADKVFDDMISYMELQNQIEELERQRDNIEDMMFDTVDDELDDITDLEDQYVEDLKPHKKKLEEEQKRLEKMREMYYTEYEKFKNECVTIFGPAKEQLKAEILLAYKEKIDIRFREVEIDERTQPHIAKLIRDPDLLTDQAISCFKQPSPTFTDDTSLNKAADTHEENIGKFRNAFTPEFTNDMKEIIRDHASEFEFIADETLLRSTRIEEDELKNFDEETREKIEEEHGEL